ncbi:MAG: XRE family transcriptional regulator [Bacteroidia bacterium]
MTLAQRIKLLRKTLDLNQTVFAAEIGITQTSLSQIEGGKNGISYDVYKAIIARFNVDPFWLMDGQGEMLRTENAAKASGSVLPLVVTVDSEGEENIVVVDKKAAAGYLQGMTDPEYVNRLPAFRLPGFYGRTFRAFEVSGDSMLPNIYPGDMLVGAYEESLQHLKNDQVYIVVLNDGSIVVKRLRKPDPNRIELRSDNTVYEPYEVSAADIAQVWQVQARLTKEIGGFPTPKNDRYSDLEIRLAELERKLKN